MISSIIATLTDKPVSSSYLPKNSNIDSIFIGMLKNLFSRNYKHYFKNRKNDLISTSSLLNNELYCNINTFEKLSQTIKEDIALFQTMLNHALTLAGIAQNPPFEINSNCHGKLYLSSKHPDKRNIELILNEIPEIKLIFKHLSKNINTFKAKKEHTRFYKAYAYNPQKTIEDYNYSKNTSKENDFSIFVIKTTTHSN